MGCERITAAQRTMARHALGLPNRAGQSYRNYYVVGYCPGPYDLWIAMVDAGLAKAAPVIHNGARRFWLTPEGARAALEPGEALDPEDFPEETGR